MHHDPDISPKMPLSELILGLSLTKKLHVNTKNLKVTNRRHINDSVYSVVTISAVMKFGIFYHRDNYFSTFTVFADVHLSFWSHQTSPKTSNFNKKNI